MRLHLIPGLVALPLFPVFTAGLAAGWYFRSFRHAK